MSMQNPTRPVLPIFGLMLMLAGCGGGGAGSGSSGQPAVTPPQDAGGGTPAPVAVRILDGYMAAPEPVADTDADGIPDAVDAFPTLQAERADAFGSNALAIDRVYAVTAGGILDAAAGVGDELTIIARGFDSAASEPLLVFAGELGPVAAVPYRVDATTWTVKSPDGATGVFAVVGNRRSNTVPIHWLSANAPRLWRIDTVLETGTIVELGGANLGLVTEARLGGVNVEIVTATDSSLRVRVPAGPTSNRLQVGAGGFLSNTIELALQHAVGISLDAGLPEGTTAVGRHGGVAFDVTSTTTVDLALAGQEPVAFYLQSKGNYSALGAIAWPDRPVAAVSSTSTLVTDLWTQRLSLPMPASQDWRDQRAFLETALELPEAQAFVAGHHAWLAGDNGWDRNAARQDVMDAIAAASAAPAATVNKTAAQQAGQIPIEKLDDIVAFTVSPTTKDKADFGDNTTVDQPRVDIPGDTYAQFQVAGHAEKVARVFDICAYPPNTPTPAGIWPSDLCLQNGTATFASAAVYRPNRKTFGWPYTLDAADLVRRHIAGPGSTEAANNGAIYLTDNRSGSANQPTLCRMQTCFVEVLTSGFGNGYKDTGLSAEERRIVRDLRMKWVFEGMIIPIIADKLGLGQVPACLPGEIYAESGFYTKVDEFVAAVRKERADHTVAKARDLFETTVAAFLKGILTGALSTDANIVECVATEVVKSEIKDKFINATRIGSILNDAMFVGGLLLTPEKFTFRVQYRAEVADVYADVGSDETTVVVDVVNGLYRDTAQTDPRMLSITGTWIADETDAANVFYPNIIFRDREGNTESFLTDDTHYIETNDAAWRQLDIPLLSLIDNAGTDLNNLVPGKIGVTVEFIHAAFDGYDGRLLRVPSPVSFELKNRPRVLGFTPASSAPGSLVTANGWSLDTLGSNPRLALYRHAGSGDFSCASPNQGTRIDIPPADTLTIPGGREISFLLPDNVDIEAFYYLCVTPSAGSAADVTVSEIPLFTLDLNRANTGLVTFSDFGRLKDDAIRLSVLNSSGLNAGLPIEFEDTSCASSDPTCERFVKLVFDIPNPGDGKRVRTIFWDNNILNSAYGLNAGSILLECIDPGGDSTCTYGISATNVQPDSLEDTGSTAVLSDAGKFAKGVKIEYLIVYP
jgi:hypothetical protein